MPAAVTSKFRIANAKEFINSFEESVNGGREDIEGKSYVYLFIGKSLAWDKTHAGYSDTTVPSPDADIQGNVYEPWRDMIAAERIIANTDISLGAKRHDWTTGTVYTAYDDQDPSITKGTSAFYVYESAAGDVFKCLDNNGGAQSTVKPTKPSADATIHVPFTTSDGYRWKYMYTISAGDITKFLSTNYIPVRTLNVHSEVSSSGAGAPTGYENQSRVQFRANNGSIETYVVTSGGAGYTAHSGGLTASQRKTVPAGTSNSTFFQLATGASTTDNFYNDAAIYLSNTTYQKGIGIIKDYGTLRINGSTTLPRAVLLYGDSTVAGDGSLEKRFAADTAGDGEDYHIGPRVETIGDGNNANAYSICTSTGAISQINTWNAGNNYTTANAVAVGGTGSGAQLRAVLSPSGGHGYDPVSELNGYNVIVSKTISGAGTGNSFPVSNEYRTVGLLRNPYLRAAPPAGGLGTGAFTTGIYAGPGSGDVSSSAAARAGATGVGGKNWYANTSTIRQATWLTINTSTVTGYTGGSWTPTADDEVKGLTSKATARVIDYNSHGNGILILGNVVANTTGHSFMTTEQIGRLQDVNGTAYDPAGNFVTANGIVVQNQFGGTSLAFDGKSTVLYEPELQPQTGDIIYLENRTPITRSSEQSEDIKIVIEF